MMWYKNRWGTLPVVLTMNQTIVMKFSDSKRESMGPAGFYIWNTDYTQHVTEWRYLTNAELIAQDFCNL